MKEITLGMGQVALVDDGDFECLNQWDWHVMRLKGHKDYAYRWKPRGGGKRQRVFMHREVLQHDMAHTDHIDGNGLNNQKINLRPASCSQNLANRGKQKNNRSGYKGVRWNERLRKWIAQTRFNGNQIHLGIFDNPKSAALLYDYVAAALWGSFAYRNLSQAAEEPQPETPE